LKGGEDMSNLSKLMSFLALLEKIPITKHLGNIIREDTTLQPFFIQPNKLPLFTAVCIKNCDEPIIGLVTYFELNLKDEILTLFFKDDEDYKIPFDDLKCMKIFSDSETLMITKALKNLHSQQTKGEGNKKCPHRKIFRIKSVRI